MLLLLKKRNKKCERNTRKTPKYIIKYSQQQEQHKKIYNVKYVVTFARHSSS